MSSESVFPTLESAEMNVTSAPISIAGAPAAPRLVSGVSHETALSSLQSSLADPCWAGYEFWNTLDSAEKTMLVDKAMKLAVDLSDDGKEASGSTLTDLLISSLKELVRLRSLGVPGSASTSPTGTGSLPRSSHSTATALSANRALGKKTSIGALSSRSLTSIMSGWSDSGDTSPILSPNTQWRAKVNSASMEPEKSPRGSPRSGTPQPQSL